MKCDECGEEMVRVDEPLQWNLSIPFTKIEIQILIFGIGKAGDWFCWACAGEEDNYRYEAAYAEGASDGWKEARNRFERPDDRFY